MKIHQNATKLLLNISKPRKKLKIIFAQNDWVHNHVTKILEKSKPITEQQQKSSEDIISKLEPLQEAIKNSPALQALPWGSQAEALPEPPLPINIGPTIGRYLIKSYGKEFGDKTFGLRNKSTEFLLEIQG